MSLSNFISFILAAGMITFLLWLLFLDHWTSYFYFLGSIPILRALSSNLSLRKNIVSGNVLGLANAVNVLSEPKGKIILSIDILTAPVLWIAGIVSLIYSRFSLPKNIRGPAQSVSVFMPVPIISALTCFFLSLALYYLSSPPYSNIDYTIALIVTISIILKAASIGVMSSSYKRSVMSPRLNVLITTVLFSAAILILFYKLQDFRMDSDYDTKYGIIEYVVSFVTMRQEMAFFSNILGEIWLSGMSSQLNIGSSVLWKLLFMVGALCLDIVFLKQAFKILSVRRNDDDRSVVVLACLSLMALRDAQKIINQGFVNRRLAQRFNIQLLVLSRDIYGLLNYLNGESIEIEKLTPGEKMFIMESLIETPDLNSLSDISIVFDILLRSNFEEQEIVLFFSILSNLFIFRGPIPVLDKSIKATLYNYPLILLMDKANEEDVSDEFIQLSKKEFEDGLEKICHFSAGLVILMTDGRADKLSMDGFTAISKYLSEKRLEFCGQLKLNMKSPFLPIFFSIAYSYLSFIRSTHHIVDQSLGDIIQEITEELKRRGGTSDQLAKMARNLFEMIGRSE